MKHWLMPKTIDTADTVKVFSGGACNILDIDGNLIRNLERDDINDWLTTQGIMFFDPQIHPDTHGTEYIFEVHYPMEQAARKNSKVHLYEISPNTFGGVTALEIASSLFHYNHPKIIYFSDGSSRTDRIPPHSREGYPLFMPHGLHSQEAITKAHYREMIKNAASMRKYLIKFAEDLDSLTINFSNQSFDGDVVITPDQIHAVDMFQAMVDASSGKRTTMVFSDDEKYCDDKGNPIFVAPEDPAPEELKYWVDTYYEEGNLLRRRLCNLIRVNVYLRIVFTHDIAIQEMRNILHDVGIAT